jgi:hypothetical protein
MSEWTDLLDDEERAEWEEIVRHFRQETVQAMDSSAFVMQFVPEDGKFNVQFALELGASIMLDKPVLALVMPGSPVPHKLRKVADEILEVDIETEEGRKAAAAAIKRFHAKLPVRS